MGTMHYALNHKSKQAVELGKYSWFEIDRKVFASVDELASVISRVLEQDWFDPDIRTKEYAQFFAQELWRIGNEYQVVTETSAWGRGFDDYLVTGSRYAEDRSLVGHRLGEYLS